MQPVRADHQLRARHASVFEGHLRQTTGGDSNHPTAEFHSDILLAGRARKRFDKVRAMHEEIALIAQPCQVKPRDRPALRVIDKLYRARLNRTKLVELALDAQGAQNHEPVRADLKARPHLGDLRSLFDQRDSHTALRKRNCRCQTSDAATDDNRIAQHLLSETKAPELSPRRRSIPCFSGQPINRRDGPFRGAHDALALRVSWLRSGGHRDA